MHFYRIHRLFKRLILSYKLTLNKRSRWLLIVFSKCSNHVWMDLKNNDFSMSAWLSLLKKNRKFRKRESALFVGSFDRLTSELKWPSCTIQFLRFKRRFDPLIVVRVFLDAYRPTSDAGKSNLFCFSFLPIPRPPSTTPSPYPKPIVRFAPVKKFCVSPCQPARRLRVGNRTLLDSTTRSRMNEKGGEELLNKNKDRRREINKYKTNKNAFRQTGKS